MRRIAGRTRNLWRWISGLRLHVTSTGKPKQVGSTTLVIYS